MVPEFQPSDAWFSDWPFDVSTLVRVAATVSGAGEAVPEFLSTLTRDHSADGVYYRGGYYVEVSGDEPAGQWRIILGSAGEDGFDSVLSAADDLVEALRAAPGEARLTWQELPATKAPG